MLLLYIIAFMPNTLGFPKILPIGGLFDSEEVIQQAFEISIKAVNKNITASKHAMGVLFTSRSERISKNVFQVSQIACELMSKKKTRGLPPGVAGVFGPQNKLTAVYVQSMCDTYGIPYIAARWDSEPKRGNIINLYPYPETLSTIFYDLIQEYKWKEYAILYDNTDALIRMSRLLKLPNVTTISVMMFHLGSGPNFRYELTRGSYRHAMKEVRHYGYRNIIIDCSYDILASVLEQALQVGLLSEKHEVIVTSLDLQTLDLEPYKYSGVNIIGVRLIDPENPIFRDILKSFNWKLADGSHLRTEAALAYDAVQLFASGYARLRQSVKGNLTKLFCNGTETWRHGYSLSNYIRNEQIYGLSGMIKFDTAGFRSEFQVDILALKKQGLQKIGTWKTDNGIEWTLGNGTEPYGMLTESSSIKTGNDRYEGFAIDIIREMSKILRFNYTFEVQADNIYGELNEMTGQWNGMLGKIIAGEADLAITDLTITAQRSNAVDFTTPFMDLGISVLYRKPTTAPPSLLSFLGPFSTNVWTYLIAAYIVVSVLLFVIGKLCPAEWTNPYPCIKEPEVLETPFTVMDTPFFVIGALLKGATGYEPVGTSTRALTIAWWFFNLIIGSTYTANLAAALSTKSVDWPFKVAEELAHQTKIKYGAKKKGSTFSFFQNSTHKPYEIMYNYMKDELHADEVLVEKNEEGVWKAQHENYAYLMESTSIEYITQRKCNLTQVGGLLDSKSYGIAMRKDAPYRIDLSGAVLKLKELGIISELQTKWWKEKRIEEICEDKAIGQVEPLKIEDVSGVFIIMISGVMLSWLVAGWSFLWNVRNLAIIHNVTYKKQIIEELKFLAKCSNTKVIKIRKKSVETINSTH